MQETEVRSIEVQATRLPIRYLLVVWLGMLSAVAYLDRTNISVAGIQIADDAELRGVRVCFLGILRCRIRISVRSSVD